MVDSDVVGCCWIELPKGKYKVREEKSAVDTDSQTPGKVESAKGHHWSADLSPLIRA